MEKGTSPRWRVVLEPREDGGVHVNLETDTQGVAHVEVLRYVLAAAAAIAEQGFKPVPTREEEARLHAAAQAAPATTAFSRGGAVLLLGDAALTDTEDGCTIVEMLNRYGWAPRRLPAGAAAFPCALSMDRAGTLARITSE